MKLSIVILIVLLCGVHLGLADELKKLNLDDALSIGLKIQTDAMVKSEGKASLKITTRWPTTVCLGEVSDLDIQNAKLVYQAKVKSELEGNAYLEMWVTVGKGQYFSKGLDSSIGGNTGWKSIQTHFLFKKGQKPDKVILNLVINGKGIVWIDDVILLKETLK